jgi:monoamine oxidase
VDFLATEIRSRDGKILDGAEVKTVRWKRRRVEVFFLRKNRAGRIDADVAIVTLSLGVLKSGTPEFDPPLTHKLDAIRELQFGNVAKIIFVFREEWWPEKNFGFVHALDEPIPTWWSDPRGPMITGWAGGPKADALANFSPTQLEQLGLEILEKIFSASSLRKKLLAAHTYNWAQDPYVLGAYSYIPPNGLDLPKLLGAPVDDTLFFAGEATATDAQMGTVFSAFDSGERAAREVLR